MLIHFVNPLFPDDFTTWLTGNWRGDWLTLFFFLEAQTQTAQMVLMFAMGLTTLGIAMSQDVLRYHDVFVSVFFLLGGQRNICFTTLYRVRMLLSAFIT